jgi:hypothetical protein
LENNYRKIEEETIMITHIRPRNGGIVLHGDTGDGPAGRIGWSQDPTELAKIIQENGGLADFVSGDPGMTKGRTYFFATDDGPEKVDNCELSTLYEWMWEYLENERLGKGVVGEISKLPESD